MSRDLGTIMECPVRTTWSDDGHRGVARVSHCYPVVDVGVDHLGRVDVFERPAKGNDLVDVTGLSVVDLPEQVAIGHHREWTEACKNGGPTTCNFGYSGLLSEAVLLGNAAFRAGGGFDWDGPNLRAKGNDAAQAFISKDHRAGWEV